MVVLNVEAIITNGTLKITNELHKTLIRRLLAPNFGKPLTERINPVNISHIYSAFPPF